MADGEAGGGGGGAAGGGSAGGGVDRTEDGRYVVVGGRRWRASDPSIPEKLRQELVDELMAARRLVRTDPATARPRVQDAKVGLGERGEPWWDTPSDAGLRDRAAATIRALLRKRDGKTICPSDAARVIGGDGWRELMPLVREVAAGLRREGTVTILQGGEDAPDGAHGPIRLGPGEGFLGS